MATLGVGLETKVSNNLTAKIEYRYTDFGSTGVDFTAPVTGTSLTA